jgi:hypothetical protein
MHLEVQLIRLKVTEGMFFKNRIVGSIKIERLHCHMNHFYHGCQYIYVCVCVYVYACIINIKLWVTEAYLCDKRL